MRWREPRAKSAPYISPAGYRQLQTDLQSLWQRRTEVTRALSAAAAEGDRSENAEYIYRKKELRQIDSRIGYLQRRMPELKVVSSVKDNSCVYFGAIVTLEKDDGESVCYQILGADELENQTNAMSIDSPLARALLGKSVDDEVTINTATGDQSYFIVDIKYNFAADDA